MGAEIYLKICGNQFVQHPATIMMSAIIDSKCALAAEWVSDKCDFVRMPH